MRVCDCGAAAAEATAAKSMRAESNVQFFIAAPLYCAS